MTEREMEKMMNQAQMYQQQIQTITNQKNALTLEINEIKKALEELDKTKDEDVYKLAGPIMLKSDKAKITKELEEKRDFDGIRLKSIEKQENEVKKKIEDIRNQLTTQLEKKKG